MIQLEVGGALYSNWISVTVERSLETISGAFRFMAIASPEDSFPIPRGQSCRVLINGYPVITGYVDRIDINYGPQEHQIAIEGRDKTCDIVDSHIDSNLSFKAPVTLEEVIKRTLVSIKANDVKVINKVKDLAPFRKEELVAGKIGEKAFEFMDKYARKRQVVLTTDGLGNVVITRASQELSPIVLRNKFDDNFNTIKTAYISYDDTERYNSYVFVTQANHSAEPDMTDTPKKSTNRRYEYLDKKVRPSRRYVAIAEGNSKERPLEDRAKWEANIREARSFLYRCTHVGHSPWSETGEPYLPNTLVTVKDDFADIDTQLLLVKVVYSLDLLDGSTTQLELMSREAFLVILSEKNNGKDKKRGTDTAKYAAYDNSTSKYFEKYKEPVGEKTK